MGFYRGFFYRGFDGRFIFLFSLLLFSLKQTPRFRIFELIQIDSNETTENLRGFLRIWEDFHDYVFFGEGGGEG